MAHDTVGPQLRRRRALATAVMAAAAAWSCPAPAGATAVTWVGGSDSWSVASNWDSGVVPGAGDDALVAPSDGTARTVTYDYAGPAVTLNSVTLDLTGVLAGAPDATTLSIPGNTLTAATEYVGYSGAAGVIQSGGANQVTGSALQVGFNAGSAGSYTMSDGSLTVSKDEYLGYKGSAAFVQSGGTHAVTGGSGSRLYLAANTGASASYSLSGTGTLTVNNNATFIGYNGGNATLTQSGGAFNSNGPEYIGMTGLSGTTAAGGIGAYVQTDGTHTLKTGTFAAPLNVGYNAGSTGSYFLQGGTLWGQTSLTIAGGAAGSVGSFVQTGGSASFNGVYVGNPGSASYSLSAGSLTSSANEFVPFNGTGTFTQTGGTNSMTGPANLILGNRAAAAGAYLLTGGSCSVAGSLQVAVAPATTTPAAAASSATVSVSGTGTLSAAAGYVGGSNTAAGGAGTLNVGPGASVSFAGALKVWNTTGSSVNFTGGTLSAASLDTVSTPAHFNWTGGTLALTGGALSLSSTGPLGPNVALAGGMSLRASTLPTFETGATLDLSGGTLVLPYTSTSPAPSVRTLIVGGSIMSTAAANDATHLTAVGYADNGTSVTVLDTYKGDANGDGTVDADDYALIDRGLLVGGTNWYQGDFNYDGVVDQNDYLLIDTTYLALHPSSATSLVAAREVEFGPAYASALVAAVPEPACGGLLVACGSLLAGARRRRR